MTAGVTGIGSAQHPGRLVSAGNAEGPREETSMLAFASILLARRRIILLAALVGTAIFGILAASDADLYQSSMSFIVRPARSSIQLPGGAAAYGVTLGGYQDFAQSVGFYADLARSGVIMRDVAGEMYATSDSKGARRSLAQIYGIKDKNPREALERAADKLSEDVTYTTSSRTGVVRVNVLAVDPLLAQQLATNILTQLDIWAKTQGHNQAVLERRFIEQQVGEAKAKLDQAEQLVSTFMVYNREYQTSPQLNLEHDRLVRDVEMQQQIYTALAQSLEQAKIEEVRSPTILSVIETADLPIEPQRRQALRKTLTGFAAGMLVGIVIAMLGQRVEEKKAYA